MGLVNILYEVINKDIVKKHNDLCSENEILLSNWICFKYTSIYLYIKDIGKEDLYSQLYYDYNNFIKIKSNTLANKGSLSYKQKKFIIERIELIKEIDSIYNHCNTISSKYLILLKEYPIVIRFMIEKYLKIQLLVENPNDNVVYKDDNFTILYQDLNLNQSIEFVRTITSLDSIKLIEKEFIVNIQNNIQFENYYIEEAVNECLSKKKETIIHKKFIENIINDERRSKYYKEFQVFINNDSEEYCINNLTELDSFILNYIKSKFNEIRNLYPFGLEFYYSSEDDKNDDLTNLDTWEECIDCLDNIIDENNFEVEYNRLLEKYPNEINRRLKIHAIYEETFTDDYSFKLEIINLGEEKISELERLFLETESNKIWIKNQDEFTGTCLNIRKKVVSFWGAYTYDIIVSPESFTNTPQKYQFWQLFISSYCSAMDLDYGELESAIKCYQKLPEFKRKQRYFNKTEYDHIIEFVIELKHKYGCILVLFADSNIDDDTFNNYHFDYLINQLEKNNIFYGTTLINPNVSYLYKYVVVIELISTNQRLKQQCAEIIAYNKSVRPHIIFISLNKEYDRNEMQKIIQKNNKKITDKKIENEKNERELQQKARLEELEQIRIIEEKNRILNYTKNWSTPSQSSLNCFSMYNYYPTTCDFEVTKEEWNVRRLIWDFKANPNNPNSLENIMSLHAVASSKIAIDMKKCLEFFFGDDVSKLTLVCIPSSKQEITVRRYKDFSSLVCKSLNMTNAYNYIKVVEDGEAKHKGGTIKAQYEIDENYFKGKYVLLFDDVITSGASMEQFRINLESYGAIVIGGFSIGKTIHTKTDLDPIACLIDYSNNIDNNYVVEDDDELPF